MEQSNGRPRHSRGSGFVQQAATPVLLVCAVAITLAAVKQAFWTAPPPGPPPGFSVANAESYQLDARDWEAVREAAMLVGLPGAPIKVAEFLDLECPFCKLFHEALRVLRDDLGEELAYYVVHSPITTRHPHALSGARAAECADSENRLWEFLDAVFSEHSLVGAQPWSEFAKQAGIADVDAFERCAGEERPLSRVEQGLELVRQHGIRGTPTVVINGWVIHPTPYENLAAVVDSVRNQRGTFAPSR